MLLQLLLLAATWPGLAHAGLLDSYIIDPVSYLDVVRPVTADQAPAGSPDNVPCSSSNGPTCSHGALRLLQDDLPTQGEATQLSTYAVVAGDVLPAHSRELQQVPANPLRFQAPYKVCVSSWAPMVRCTPGEDQANFKGYQIELFRMAAKEVGWADDDYAFECMDYTLMMEDLLSPGGNCSLSATGIEVFPEHLLAGLKFSWPTYKSGLRVMISAHLQTGSTWAFAEIFRWEVWLMLGVTSIALGVLVAILERINSLEAQQQAGFKGKTWQSWLWYSLAKIVHVIPHVGDPNSDASRVLVLGYGFLVMVMVSMYTAFAASQITAAALIHPVHSQKDLEGQGNVYKTVTWECYLQKLKDHQHIYADGKPWERERGEKERDGDMQVMLEGLKSGAYSALVLDVPVLEYVAGTNEACDLFLVGDVFESFSLALAFPPAFSDATVFAFSQSIVKLQTYQGALDMLENVYIKTGGTDKCYGSGNAGGHGSGETIELRQVSGLWYILLITVGVCFIATLAHNVRKDLRKMARIRHFSSFIGGSTNTDAAARTAVEAFHANGSNSSSMVQHNPATTSEGPHQHSALGAAGPQIAGMNAAASTQNAANSSGHMALDSAGDRGAAGRASQQDGKSGQASAGVLGSQGAGATTQAVNSTRGRSTLQVFLGTSSSFVDSDDELESPTSPKKMPTHLHH